MSANAVDNVLGLVVARGGSKGVPGKNIRPLGGHPLVAYAVRAGVLSPSISRTIISTDDPAIADAAAQYGADVPFMRPSELASDTAAILDTVIYTLKKLEQDGERYDAVCLLQPTTPFRMVQDIEGAIDQCRKDSAADSAIALAEVVDEHPSRLRRIVSGGSDEENEHDRVVQFLDTGGDIEGQQRQDHGQQTDQRAYRRTGACYVARRETVLSKNSLYGDNVAPWIMPAWRCVNIDDELDLVTAHAMLEHSPFKEKLAYLREWFA